jgi:hypothetical protein
MASIDLANAPWQPKAVARERVGTLIGLYRDKAREILYPLVLAHYSAMLADDGIEYRKMVELSTKMMVVGNACTEVLGHDYDERRQMIAGLFGGCCFLADSFLDDFGEEAAQSYVARFGELLATGWFELKTDRERLFYAIIARLFAERDILDPVARQAIALLHRAQAQDVAMRSECGGAVSPRRLADLKICARNRSGHAILVLCVFLVPQIPLERLTTLFAAGALVMYIDDHGDSFADLTDRRVTFMNQVTRPERALRRLFLAHIGRLYGELPAGDGRDLLIAFLTRYYVTRVEKNRHQRRQVGSAWAVYE